MARDSTQKALDRLAILRDAPTSAELIRALESLLIKGSGPVVASVARLLAARELRELENALIRSFDRFLGPGPSRLDPLCIAKEAIVRALVSLETGMVASELYRKGSLHVQPEATADGRVDTAAELRGICAEGLVLAGTHDLWLLLADLLADPEVAAQIGAIRAVAQTGNPHMGAPLLRLRLGSADADSRVPAECLSALISLDPVSNLEYVAARLSHPNPNLAEGAAFALGESRSREAVDLLGTWLEGWMDPDLRRVGYLALSMLRLDEATSLLLRELDEAPIAHAELALRALTVAQPTEAVKRRIETAVTARGDAGLERLLAELVP